MAPEDHNRLLGWGFVVHATFFALMGLMFAAMFGSVGLAASMDPKPGDEFPAAFFGMFGIIFGLFYVGMSLPSFIAGVGLLRRRSWAKIWAIIAGAMAGMSFPLGTAMCVYTFWFLFSDPGKALYASEGERYQPRPAGLYGQPAAWEFDPREAKTREYQYTPPAQPPNWRGDD